MKRGVIILGVMLCFNLFGASPSFQQVTNIANNEATNIVVAYTNSLASTNFVNGAVSNRQLTNGILINSTDTIIGNLAGDAGGFNTVYGALAFYLASGSLNTVLGIAALSGTPGVQYTNNIAIGYGAGLQLQHNPTTNCIIIGNGGQASDNNVIRIGDTQSAAYIAGNITGNGSGLTNLNYSNITNPPAIPTTNQFVGTNFVLVSATNIAAALTNQLVIPTTNNLISTATNLAWIAASNGIQTATNGLGSGGISAVTATNISSNQVYTATNGFGDIVTHNSSEFLTTNRQFSTTSNPTNQYVANTLYTNLTGCRALLVGEFHIASNGDTAWLFYTNSSVGYSLRVDYYSSGANFNLPFCVPLNTNSTFIFTSTYSASYPTNTVLWAMP